MKPYYQDDWVTIYHGDCREILPELPKVDLVLTDPPYGINWNCDYSKLKKGPNSTSTSSSARKYPAVYGDDKPFDPSFLLGFPVVILWGANCYLQHLGKGTLLIWYKRRAEFLCQAEAAWMNKGQGCYVFEEPVENMQAERTHPTQKPIKLMSWCIGHGGKAETILDPFMGNGTTLRAAKDLKRKAIGIEIEEKYCEIAANRMSQEVLI